MISRQVLQFSMASEKAAWLASAALDDACCPVVEQAASLFCDLPLESRATAIHAFVRDGIAYVRDPDRREQFADSAQVLERGWDDCDGKARLFVAMCIAAGLEAKIFPRFDGAGQFVHVQALVKWPGSEARPDATGAGWVLAELILAGVELGQGLESAQYNDAGEVITS